MKRNGKRGPRNAVVSAVLFLVTTATMALAESPSAIRVGSFSTEAVTDALPAHWETFTFRKIERHTRYRLIEADGKVVVKAVAEASASGLIRKIRIDPLQYPVVRWRWKIADTLKNGNVREKTGDDYPARIYVVFEYVPGKLGFYDKTRYEIAKLLYGQYPPLATLNYIWASHAPRGVVVPNAFTDRAMMVVVESGKTHLHTWVDEERNVYEDYRRAFGDEPPLISGVAIMTDTDNTGESATAWYGDIVFLRQRP